ncbi:MAG: CDP-diacylglycerol--glycerol-3-phosphate 3-phosphatidyltransferase [Clostridia bacterium]|nr:CDP-diacylglycerol--glycerol-3-phosphate 3-phosphatidyltransferase [Clostridia bacterium]
MGKMNLPNKLTVLRIVLVPVCWVIIMLPPIEAIEGCEMLQRIIGAALFVLLSFTDFLDGMIARKYNYITDFGKFLDPLADKFLVIGTLLAIAFKDRMAAPAYTAVLFISIIVVVMRELAVTSLRLLVSNKSGEVIAAKWLGKIKTVSQMVCIIVILMEPVLFGESRILSYITISFMTIMTILSGIDYFRSYWSFIDFTK